MVKRNYHQEVMKTAAKILNLPKNTANILKIIAKEKEMRISEIIEKMRLSERCVRNHLKILSEKGLLEKMVEVRKNKRLCYKYSVTKIKKIESILKDELSRRMKEINYVMANAKKHAV